ncbi:hypothetical protein L917_15851 [Phytophthora nicotianae]|uniref:Tyr recombinase domain-containing protein n=1 Tax=Phytophthora nicotianae TaxID=4792 RepID=W2KI32_PHYNI|nr:hypothetical protein L917_15851 [Phytophthora nicotianae]
MSDFSVSAKFLAAPDPSSWEDVLAGANGFQHYRFTRCDTVTQHLGTALYSLVVELKARKLWPQDMLLTLVLWIDAQLEKYRSAVVRDITAAPSTRCVIVGQFTPNNVELHGLFLAEQRNQFDAIRQSAANRSPQTSNTSRQTRSQRNTTDKPRREQSDNYSPLPQQDGKEVCLKFLSRNVARPAIPTCASLPAERTSTQRSSPTNCAIIFEESLAGSTATTSEEVQEPMVLRSSDMVLKALRKGQDDGQYLILDIDVLEHWKNIQVSPLGAVPKKYCDPKEDIRLIHDLSFPRGSSTNDLSTPNSSPEIEFKHVSAVARRILACCTKYTGAVVKIMKGDVKSAFRHLMLASDHVRWMAATIQTLGVLIIDMSAPFGWTSSPAFYGAFGGAITWLVSHESPNSMDPRSDDHEPFFVDDHILVKPHVGNRLHLANEALRLSMLAVLGPTSINEEKFSVWETRLQVFGLEFDTVACTISMPDDKIAKALGRVKTMQHQRHTTRTQLQQLLGSLRHVCSCLRAAKPFYQRLQSICTRAPRYGKVAVDGQILDDLLWFEAILSVGRLQKLPLAIFTNDQPADVHLYMDASNCGLAVLNPATKQYIQLIFDKAEQDLIDTSTGCKGFNINVREQLCVALAARIFGPTLASNKTAPVVLVKAWFDNTSAVSWTKKLSSSNPMAHEVNRAIGLAEALFGFRMRCGHLPGSINTMADAGSRVGSPPHDKMWSNFSFDWQQIPVPFSLRKIYSTFSTNFNRKHWPLDQGRSTRPHGNDGQSGAPPTVSMNGYTQKRSEYLADGTRIKPYTIRTNDVKFLTNQGVITGSLKSAAAVSIHFRGSKTDQAGSGMSRTLHRSGSTWLCPVLAAWELVQITRCFEKNAVLFSTSPGRVLTANVLGDAIKTAVASIGADPAKFGTHSMRSGGATALFAAGTDRLTIKIFGRWSSDAFELYTRMNDTVSKSLSQRMTQGAMSRVSPATPEGPRPAQHS